MLEIYADIWCPFAHVGLRAAVHERSRLGRDDVELIVRAWPLELVNGTPLDVVATTRHVNELRDQVAPGLFAGFVPSIFPTTSLPALALASAAYQRSSVVGEAVSLALRDALFERGQDVSQTAVLEAIASPYELEWSHPRFTALVHDEWHRGQLRKVKGSPHFYCGEREAFCPALDITRDLEGGLLMQRNGRELERFLATCFQP